MRLFALRYLLLGLIGAGLIGTVPARAQVGTVPAPSQDRDGDFTIRFEPSAKLQSKTEVPFQIDVLDSRQRPVEHATVVLRIKDKDNMNVTDFKSIMTASGVYLAKPVFPAAGEWSVNVEVRRDGLMTARTINFTVSE